MPTSSLPSTTGSEPTFSEAMSFAASVTDALPAIVVGFSVIEARTVVLCMIPPSRVYARELSHGSTPKLRQLDAFDRHGLDRPVAAVGVDL